MIVGSIKRNNVYEASSKCYKVLVILISISGVFIKHVFPITIESNVFFLSNVLWYHSNPLFIHSFSLHSLSITLIYGNADLHSL